MKLSRYLAAGAAILFATAIAWGAGMWSTLPIVGQGSFCASTVTGAGGLGGITGQGQATTGSICAQTVPAGPTALTGSELVPADTELAGGAPPQTVTIPVPLLASGAYAYQAVTATGLSFAIPNSINTYLLDPTGTVSALTLTMPTTPLEGQIVRIASSATITALGVVGAAGQSVSNAPTALTISTTGAYNYDFIYRATNTKWYRLQ